MTKPCHYCGIEPKQTSYGGRTEKQREYNNFIFNGIDRIDNNKGYIQDNVVACCKLCNWAKRALSYSEFTAYIDRFKTYRRPEMLYSAEFVCTKCNTYWEDLIDRDKKDEDFPCPHCGELNKKKFSACRVMEAAWPDGRKREDNYYIEKMARKEEAKAMDLPVEKRKEVRKEVNKIRKEIK